MMKKVLAFTVAVVLTFSLCAPAAALSEDYWSGYYDGSDAGEAAGYQDYLDGKPAQSFPVDNYDGGYAAGFAECYEDGYESAREDTDPDYQRGYGDGYEKGFADGKRGDYALDAYDYDTAYDIGYVDGYDEGFTDALWGSYDSGAAKSVDEIVTDYGGKAGAVNVMLNGECLDFADTAPVNRNGRVMVPMRAILETLGATVSYDAQTRVVSASMGTDLLVHTIGTEMVEVYPGGDMAKEPAVTEMDCVSYISGGRAMVPVRFFSETLGFYVAWDGVYQTVVILDLADIEAAYADELYVLNLILSDALASRDPAANYREDADIQLDMTLFDTLNGDKRIGASADISTLSGAAGVNATMKLDISQVLDLLSEDYLNEIDSYGQKILNLAKKLNIDIIYNAKTQQIYVKSPLIDALLEQETWVSASLSSYLGDVTMPAFMEDGQISIVDYAALIATQSYSAFYAYETIEEMLDGVCAAFGTSNFVKSGNTYTLSEASRKAFADLMSEMIGYYYRTMSFDINFKLVDTGKGTCTYTASLYLRTDDVEFSADMTKNSTSQKLTCKLHVKNMFKAALNANSSFRKTTEAIQTTPPTTEISMDFEEIYY